jgi:predicted N-acyltransferase
MGAGVCYFTTEKVFGFPIPVIYCTYPLSEKMALFTRESEDREVFSMLIETLESIARNRKAKAIIITKSPGGLYGKLLRQRAYHYLHLIPTTYLDIPWNTFQEYLKSLPRKAKKNIRHTLNQGKRKGLRITHTQNLSDIEHLYDLFKAAMDRHGHQHLIPCTLEVFQNFVRYVNECTYVARCYLGNDLLGYWMYFFDGDTASLAISGIDKTYSKEYNTYFNICYDTIREMIERKCKRAWFGITTYDVKRRIGCTIQPTAVSISLCNPLLNILFTPVVAFRNYYLRKTYEE